jgi:hypothetical protein
MAPAFPNHCICHIILDQYHPSGLKALWMIWVSRDDTAYDTDFAMYYSLYSKTYKLDLYRQTYYYISCIIRQGGQNKRNENQLLQYQ